jgi:hypothetical protein
VGKIRSTSHVGFDQVGEEVDTITEILKKRLEKDSEIYSAIGQNVLVALNPYQALSKVDDSRRSVQKRAIWPFTTLFNVLGENPCV